MNCRTMFFICFLLALILPSANCHSVSRRKASPFFHILFPRRRRFRKPKKIRLSKPPQPQLFNSYENQLNHEFKEPPIHPPPPVNKPESFHLGQPHGEGHSFGPYDVENYKNQNSFYEDPSNHISPHSLHSPIPPQPHYNTNKYPQLSLYSIPPSSHPQQPNSASLPPQFGPLSPHSEYHPPYPSSYPSHSGPHPPPPSPSQNSPKKKNRVRFHIIKTPPVSLNEIVSKPKPEKFPQKPKKPYRIKVAMFDLQSPKGRKKNIADIVKETIYYGEYPKKDIVINKERVQPVLLPAGVRGLDPNTLDYIKEQLKEFTQNRS